MNVSKESRMKIYIVECALWQTIVFDLLELSPGGLEFAFHESGSMDQVQVDFLETELNNIITS